MKKTAAPKGNAKKETTPRKPMMKANKSAMKESNKSKAQIQNRIDLIDNQIDLKTLYVILSLLINRSKSSRLKKLKIYIMQLDWTRQKPYINYRIICENTDLTFLILIRYKISTFSAIYISPQKENSPERVAVYFNPNKDKEFPQNIQTKLIQDCDITVETKKPNFDDNENFSAFYVIDFLFDSIMGAELKRHFQQGIFLRSDYKGILDTNRIFLYDDISEAYNKFSSTYSPKEYIQNIAQSTLSNLVRKKKQKSAFKEYKNYVQDIIKEENDGLLDIGIHSNIPEDTQQQQPVVRTFLKDAFQDSPDMNTSSDDAIPLNEYEPQDTELYEPVKTFEEQNQRLPVKRKTSPIKKKTNKQRITETHENKKKGVHVENFSEDTYNAQNLKKLRELKELKNKNKKKQEKIKNPKKEQEEEKKEKKEKKEIIKNARKNLERYRKFKRAQHSPTEDSPTEENPYRENKIQYSSAEENGIKRATRQNKIQRGETNRRPKIFEPDEQPIFEEGKIPPPTRLKQIKRIVKSKKKKQKIDEKKIKEYIEKKNQEKEKEKEKKKQEKEKEKRRKETKIYKDEFKKNEQKTGKSKQNDKKKSQNIKKITVKSNLSVNKRTISVNTRSSRSGKKVQTDVVLTGKQARDLRAKSRSAFQQKKQPLKSSRRRRNLSNPEEITEQNDEEMTDRNEQKSAEQEQSSIPETWEDRIQEEITDQNILSDKKKSAERKNDSEKPVNVSQKRNKKASLSNKSTGNIKRKLSSPDTNIHKSARTEKQPESDDESDLEFENNTLQSGQALHNSQDLNIKSNETPGSTPRKKTESPITRSGSKKVQENQYNLRSRQTFSPSDEKDSPQNIISEHPESAEGDIEATLNEIMSGEEIAHHEPLSQEQRKKSKSQEKRKQSNSNQKVAKKSSEQIITEQKISETQKRLDELTSEIKRLTSQERRAKQTSEENKKKDIEIERLKRREKKLQQDLRLLRIENMNQRKEAQLSQQINMDVSKKMIARKIREDKPDDNTFERMIQDPIDYENEVNRKRLFQEQMTLLKKEQQQYTLIKEDELKQLDEQLKNLQEGEEDRRREILEEKEAIVSEMNSNLSKKTRIITTLEEKKINEDEMNQLRMKYQAKLQQFNDEKAFLETKIQQETKQLKDTIKRLADKTKQKELELKEDYTLLQKRYFDEQKQLEINKKTYEEDLKQLQEERDTEQQNLLENNNRLTEQINAIKTERSEYQKSKEKKLTDLQNELQSLGDLNTEEKERLKNQVQTIQEEMDSKISEYDTNQRVLSKQRKEEIEEQKKIIEQNKEEIDRLTKQIVENDQKEQLKKIKFETDMNELKNIKDEELLKFRQEQEKLQKQLIKEQGTVQKLLLNEGINKKILEDLQQEKTQAEDKLKETVDQLHELGAEFELNKKFVEDMQRADYLIQSQLPAESRNNSPKTNNLSRLREEDEDEDDEDDDDDEDDIPLPDMEGLDENMDLTNTLKETKEKLSSTGNKVTNAIMRDKKRSPPMELVFTDDFEEKFFMEVEKVDLEEDDFLTRPRRDLLKGLFKILNEKVQSQHLQELNDLKERYEKSKEERVALIDEYKDRLQLLRTELRDLRKGTDEDLQKFDERNVRIKELELIIQRLREEKILTEQRNQEKIDEIKHDFDQTNKEKYRDRMKEKAHIFDKELHDRIQEIQRLEKIIAELNTQRFEHTDPALAEYIKQLELQIEKTKKEEEIIKSDYSDKKKNNRRHVTKNKRTKA